MLFLDITPPNIKCPKDVSGVTLSGKKYGFVHWNTETDITGEYMCIQNTLLISNVNFLQ